MRGRKERDGRYEDQRECYKRDHWFAQLGIYVLSSRSIYVFIIIIIIMLLSEFQFLIELLIRSTRTFLWMYYVLWMYLFCGCTCFWNVQTVRVSIRGYCVHVECLGFDSWTGQKICGWFSRGLSASWGPWKKWVVTLMWASPSGGISRVYL